ncbi:ROK family protein [Labedella phragmitis]|uniref:ROK family protein n=1 Tax=Labedella phragmitis TaxID=2498849 RepID=A0A444PY20_9MICO|nr:ROK family protein [Labedella phragmitis]RWZ52819.1 ROK family protein [Labedella phragmitis]
MNPAPPMSSRHAPRWIRVLDVGGSHVTAAILVTDGRVARVENRVDRDIDPHAERIALLDDVTEPAYELAPSASEIVVAMPGPFDDVTGIGSFDGVAKFASIAGLPLHHEFARRLDLTPGDVVFLNDAVAYGIGEWAFGSAERARRFVCITLGTGVGSAFLDDGDPVTEGSTVPRDGHAFRITVHGGPLEDTMSSRAIMKAYAERTGEIATVADIAAAARAGDSVASAVLDHAVHALGVALAPWLARFDTEELVIGGSISRSWDLLEPSLRRGLADGGGTPALVRRSELLADAPLVGAAAYYLRSEVDVEDS